MKGNIIKKFTTSLILLLFFITLFLPKTIGYKNDELIMVDNQGIDNILEDLSCDCRDSCSYPRFEYIKERLLGKKDLSSYVIEDEYDFVNNNKYYKTGLQNPINPLSVSGGLMNSSWPMKSHDNRHT